MQVKDQKVWESWVENNKDGYGRAVIVYAESWANMMEEAMAEGKKLEDVAGTLSHKCEEADQITGFQYGAAVSTLLESWVHGEALRVWHNAKYDVPPTESGVVNPAILTFKVPDEA